MRNAATETKVIAEIADGDRPPLANNQFLCALDHSEFCVAQAPIPLEAAETVAAYYDKTGDQVFRVMVDDGLGHKTEFVVTRRVSYTTSIAR